MEIPRVPYVGSGSVLSESGSSNDSLPSIDLLDVGLLSASAGCFQGPPAVESDVL